MKYKERIRQVGFELTYGYELIHIATDQKDEA